MMDNGKLERLASPHEFVAATDPLAKAYLANLRMYEAAEHRAEGAQ